MNTFNAQGEIIQGVMTDTWIRKLAGHAENIFDAMQVFMGPRMDFSKDQYDQMLGAFMEPVSYSAAFESDSTCDCNVEDVCTGISQVGAMFGNTNTGNALQSYGATCELETTVGGVLASCTDLCVGKTCSGNGDCTATCSVATCRCNYGWSGDNCETRATFCTAETCLNGGICHEGKDYITNTAIVGYTCECAGGFSGSNCRQEPFFRFPVTASLTFEGVIPNNDDNIVTVTTTTDTRLAQLVGNAGVISAVVESVAITPADDTTAITIVMVNVVQGTSFRAARRKRDATVLNGVVDAALTEVATNVATSLSTDENPIASQGVTVTIPNPSTFEVADSTKLDICVNYCQNGGICSVLNPFASEKECACGQAYTGDTCQENRTVDILRSLDESQNSVVNSTSGDNKIGFSIFVAFGLAQICW